jgi:DNA-binding PadR family transcriptional regulator
MSLRHALLGWLSLSPGTGYELKARLDQSTQYFWTAELSQIYPTLKSLQAEGLVDMEVQHQVDRPSRKVYSITPGGQAELRSWLGAPSAEPTSARDSFLVKVFFGSHLEPEVLLGQLHDQLRLHEDKLSYYDHDLRQHLDTAIRAQWPRERLFWELALERAVIYEQGYVDFCRLAIARIEAERPGLAGPQPEFDKQSRQEPGPG